MTELRWGILGLGGIANAFTKDLIANGMIVAAVGSRSQEKANAFAGQHGVGAAFGSYENLAASPDVDAIYIATPHPFHAKAAALAIKAGKHVLIEKPITLNAQEAASLKGLGEAHDVFVMEAMWTRFLPHMVRIRQILAEGTIGEIKAVFAAHTKVTTDDPAHRLNNLELGGGALLDLGVYPISFTYDVLGDPSTVMSTGRLSKTGVDAEVSAHFRYASGASALVIMAIDASGPNTASVHGTKGYIEIEGTWCAPSAFRVFDSKKVLIEDFPRAEINGRGMHFQAREVERLVSVGERTSSIMPITQSVAIMETMDTIRKQIGLEYPNGKEKPPVSRGF